MISRFSAKDYFEKQYVLRKSIPTFAQHIAEWEELSADENFSDLQTSILSYGSHPRQTFELLKAGNEPSKKGLAIFIHGGFWRAISREQSRFMARPFIEHGYDCIIAEYRLMPEFKMAQLVDDASQMLLTVQKMQMRGELSNNLLLAGHSAGAHLAAFGLEKAIKQGFAQTDCALIYLSGVFDIYPVSSTTIGDELAMTQDEIKRWSIYDANHSRNKNSVFIVGARETDEFKRQSIIGAQFLGLDDSNCILEVPKANHLTLLTKFAQDQSLSNEILSELSGRSSSQA